MQISIHPAAQRQSTGSSDPYQEPGFAVTALIISVSNISVDILGNVTMKLQHSADSTNWFDVPNLATGNITGPGAITVSLAGGFATGNYVRLVWTFNNANSITFTAFAVGVK